MLFRSKDVRRLHAPVGHTPDSAKIGIVRRVAIGALDAGAEQVYAAADLGRIAERAIWVRRDRNDSIGNAYRALRSMLSLAHHDRDDTSRAPITLMISSGPGDGKTTATANLAAAFAETGARTVAVNTDFRRPSLGAVLDARSGAAHASEAPVRIPVVLSGAVKDLRVDRKSTRLNSSHT